MQPVNPGHLVGHAGPPVQDVQRRKLILRKALQGPVTNAHERLHMGHPEYHLPVTPGWDLLQGGFPTQGDQ